MSLIRVFVLLVLLALGMPACAGPSAKHHSTLAFAEVAEPDAQAGRDYALRVRAADGADHVRLLEPEVFDVASASYASDEFGSPGVGFDLAPHEQDRFRAWTAERVNRKIAVLVDGRVLQVVTIRDALPGRGIISGGAQRFTNQEVHELVAGLESAAH